MAHHSTLAGQIERHGLDEGTKRFEKMTERKRELAKTRNTLEGFIQRYGDTDGLMRYESFKNKSKHTKENFTKQYGEEIGIQKFNEYSIKRNNKNIRCLEYWMNQGYSTEEASNLLRTAQHDFNSLTKFIKKYGNEGLLKWQERYKQHSFNISKNGFIEKYGNEIGLTKYEKYRRDRIMTLERFIEIYGENEGKQRYLDRNKKSAHTLENYISRYGEEEGIELFTSRWASSNISQASKSSLKIFTPVIEWLIGNNLSRDDDIFIGTGDKKEYFLRDENNIYWYDLVIKNLNIIIEYNGIHIHPKPIDENKDSWQQAFTDL